MRSSVIFEVCAFLRWATHGDIDTVVSEDDGGVRRGELGGRHRELICQL